MTASILTDERRTRACRQWHAIAFALIIVTGITAYSNSIHGSFHFDDPHTIAENRSIQSLNPTGIWAANNRFRFAGFYSFALNYRLNGLDDVRGWHYVNIGIHICCALLFYTVMSLLMQNAGRAESKVPLAASILFVAHPLCSEPVNYIQARHVLFYSFFSLSGLLCAVLLARARAKTSGIIWALGIAMSIVLGGLSKEVGMFYVPAIIGAHLYAFGVLEGPDRAVFRRISAVAAAAAGIALIMIMNRLTPVSKIFQLHYNPMTGERATYIDHLLTQTQIFWRYVSLFVPLSSRLNVDHYVRIVKTETFAQTLRAVIPVLGMAVGLAAAFKVRRRGPVWSFLILWVILGVLPYLLVHVSAEYMVEYRAYLPAMGLAGLSVLCLSRLTTPLLLKRLSRRAYVIPAVVFALLVTFCVRETRARNRIWESEITLWSDAARKSPEKARPYNNLGDEYNNIGLYEEAIPLLKKAIEIKPDLAGAHYNLGNAYYETGENEAAIASYKKALEIKPDYLKAINNLGNVYNSAGLYQEAIALLRRAAEIEPVYHAFYNNLGNAYHGIGENEEAIACYGKAIELNPDPAEPYYNSGVVHLGMGRHLEAIRCFGKAVQIKPDYAEAYNNLGNAYHKTGQHEEAVVSYRKAVGIRPDYAEAYINLSIVCFRERQYELAIEYCDRAADLGAADPALLETLKPHRR